MMSSEKERLRRLVSWRRSEERCKPRRPCCSALVAGAAAGAGGSPLAAAALAAAALGAPSLAALASAPPVAALSEVGGGSGGSGAAGPVRGSGDPGRVAPSPCRAASSFRLRSYSSSWPRKLKLGEMDGRRSFTNLGREGAG